MYPAEVALAIPIIAIIGGFVMAGLSFHHQSKRREMAHRERMAMIERGLLPPPEMDPLKPLDGGNGRLDSRGAPLDARHRTAGVTLIGIGFGLMLLIALAGNTPRVGVGVGGAVAVLGAAFFVNSYLAARTSQAPGTHEFPPAAPSGPPDRPGSDRSAAAD
jgi:hypothetical protein